MLGLADRTRVIDLFEALMRGDMGKALGELRDQYDSGADPAVVLSDLAEFTHFVTRVKVVPSVADDPSLAEAERTRGRSFAAQLSMRVLSRTWQMLFKGLQEVQSAGQAAGGGRDGAGAHCLCGRPADAGRGDAQFLQNGAAPSAPGSGTGGGGAAAARPPLAPRLDAPRGAPARLAGAGAADDRTGARHHHDARRSGRRTDACGRELSGADRARGGEARSRDQDRARARRAAGAVRGRQARDRARAGRAPHASCRTSNAKCPNGPDGAGWWWFRRTPARRPCSSRAPRSKARWKQDVRADPLVQKVLARFPGAEIVGVRRRGRCNQPTRRRRGDEPPPNPDDYGASDMDDEP